MNSVDFYFEDVKPFRGLDKEHIKFHINNLVNRESKEPGDISIIFCSDDYLLKLNEQYLNHDYYTDIITFDYTNNSTVSGDLFISVDRVKENAVKFGASFKKELYRVIFHGVLHLTGYADKTKEEKALMRSKEEYYLNKVDFSAVDL